MSVEGETGAAPLVKRLLDYRSEPLPGTGGGMQRELQGACGAAPPAAPLTGDGCGRERVWRYSLELPTGERLYAATVEERTVVNCSTGARFVVSSYEVSYCGPGSPARGFTAMGDEEDTETAEAAMLLAAEGDHARRSSAAPGSTVRPLTQG